MTADRSTAPLFEGLYKKSSFSIPREQNCVEVAHRGDLNVHALRDTQNRALGHVPVDTSAMAAFLRTAAFAG